MGRVLTVILALYWVIAFAFSAAAWSGAERFAAGSDMPAGWEAFARLALGAGCALTATLFAWLAVSAMLDRDGVPGQADEVAYTAFAGAAASVTFAALLRHFSGWAAIPYTDPSITALLASYVVIHVERRAWGRPSRSGLAEIRAAARRMALDAAHDTLLSRLAPRIRAANDEGMR